MLAAMTACGGGKGESVEARPARDTTDYYANTDTLPEERIVRMHINPIYPSLGAEFNDVNDVQLPVARKLGIVPVDGLASAWSVSRPVRRITSCREYYVDNLTHSVPFLVPEAADLLKEIGSRFNDSLVARGGGDYRIKVTSVLRTARAVKRLRRRNVNATVNSAHQYGTTFDISYSKFACDTTSVERSQEDLKNLLAEVLKAVRDEKKCYVKYERRQGCFHITARPLADNRAENDD